MHSVTPDYYVIGGTLPATADSYVLRHADGILVRALMAGEMCYVLSSRQMGKSSLMVRAAVQIREAGGHALLLDLTAIGRNVTPEQWYLGLLCQFGDLAGCLDELLDLWSKLSEIGPLQRFVGCLRKIEKFWPSGPIVIFIDEIDAVKQLPFSTDEFFAAIRECHNRKAIDAELGRITFCLLGVAVPSDLIQDTSATPFNIGRGIVLTDFTAEEAATLQRGLNQASESAARAILRRVLYWTSGQPYMTQRLCFAVRQCERAITPHDVDRICRDLFMQPAARDSDPNLAFAQRCLLAYHQEDSSELLVYHRILLGEKIDVDDSNPVHNRLLLSGVVRQHRGQFAVRNRIIAAVFDKHWVGLNLPRSEIQLQRFVYLRGLRRGALLSAYTLIVLLGAIYAISGSRRQAYISGIEAKRNGDRAYRLAYDYQFAGILARMNHSGLAPGLQALSRTLPPPGKPDLREFEWYYLDKICSQGAVSHGKMPGAIGAVAWNRSGTQCAYCSGNIVRLWNTKVGTDVGAIDIHRVADINSAAFAPDGQSIALGLSDNTIAVYQISDKSRLLSAGFRGHTAAVNSVAYSHDGKQLVSGSADGTARVWNTANGKEIATLPSTGRLPRRGIWKAQFSPDETLIATAGDDGQTRIWNTASRQQVRAFSGHTSYVHSLDFSLDGKLLATAGGDSALFVWDVVTGRQVQRMFGHTSYIYDVAFSPDGKTVASCGWDKSTRIWSLANGSQIRFIPTKTNGWSLAFSPDSRSLATGTSDGDFHVYNAANDPVERKLEGITRNLKTITISADDRRVIACGSGSEAIVWNADTGSISLHLYAETKFSTITVSGDGRYLARCGQSEWDLYDTDSGQILHRTAMSNKEPIVSAALSQDGGQLITLGDDCILWDARTGTVLHRVRPPKDSRDVVFGAAGNRAAILTKTGSPYLYDVKRGFDQVSLTSTHDAVPEIYFSGDGWTLMGIGLTVMLWDAKSGQLKTTLPDLDALYVPATITADNSRLIYGTQFGLVRLWDLTTNQAVMDLPDVSPGASKVGVSPDGRLLAIQLSSGLIRLLDTRK